MHLRIGALILALSSTLAGLTRELRGRRIASSSYLPAARVAERRDTMRWPENRNFDVARVCIFGGLLIVGGIIGIVRALGG